MNGGFRVDPELLDGHAARVDALAERVGRAAGVARPLGLSAYGLIGQVFAVAAVGAARSGSDAVGRVAARAVAHADGMRRARDEYRAVERQTAAGFGRPR